MKHDAVAGDAVRVDVHALGKVAVLMGGTSAERKISLMSGSGVLAALRSQGVDAHAFDPAERDLIELKREGYQRCFIAMAEASTPEPVYGRPSSSSAPCTLPSSPWRPCSAMKQR